MKFDAPIPGESLTGAPKQYPWERPPEMNDPEEVIQFYLNKMVKPDVLEGLMDALEVDITVKDLTEGTLRMGVANGLHSIDVSLIIAPVIHEFIVSAAQELGIEYDEGFVDVKAKKKDEEAKRYLKAKKRLEKMALKGGGSVPKPSAETVEQYKEEDFQEVPEEPVKQAPKGLLERRG